MLNIRILPMDKVNEHCNRTIKEMQNDFFMDDLPRRYDNIGGGKYCYKKSGMSAKKGTVVLFQYDNHIIAMAEIENIIKFENEEDGYLGTYYFKPETIKIFKPINNYELNNIFDVNIKFSRIKHTLDFSKLNDFVKSLKNIRKIDTEIIDTDPLPRCQKKECSN